MTIESITKFCEAEKMSANECLKISFQKRNTVYGLLVQAYDYNDLKAKNFWRIVTSKNIPAWRKNKDLEVAKIFNGSEITRLSVVTDQEAAAAAL